MIYSKSPFHAPKLSTSAFFASFSQSRVDFAFNMGNKFKGIIAVTILFVRAFTAPMSKPSEEGRPGDQGCVDDSNRLHSRAQTAIPRECKTTSFHSLESSRTFTATPLEAQTSGRLSRNDAVRPKFPMLPGKQWQHSCEGRASWRCRLRCVKSSSYYLIR